MAGGGKTDMERIGLFSEMGYISIGDTYVTTFNRPFNEAASKNRQMIPGGSKMKSALQAGYFDPVFKRVFDSEAYSDPVKQRRLFRMEESKKNVGQVFRPNDGEKKRYAENERHRSQLKGGPFRLNMYPREYFDVNPFHSDRPLPPLKKTEEKIKEATPFKPSSPAKEPGGMKAGTFEPYPLHSDDPYRPLLGMADTASKGGSLFHPPSGPKSRPVQSVIAAHVVKSMTPMNYKNVHLSSY
ncbi:cilia-and flagella-associated protein 96 [Lissotriton helveticus]